MKRFILGGLSLFLLSVAVAPAVQAQQSIKSAAAPTPADFYTGQLQPFNLVYMGYQGFFEAQGIPQNAAFLTSEVTPEVLVEAAVTTGRLPAVVLEDSAYLNAVAEHLRTIRDIGDT